MRVRPAVSTAVSTLALAVTLFGQAQQSTPPPAGAAPPPQEPQQQPPPQPPGQQPPIFRVETDVIRLDVSVLDKDRHPIHGLTAEDFTVNEDGKPQRIVAVSEVNSGENDPPLSPWMRYTPRDVADNDLPGQTADGRIVALMLDDVNVPWDDLDLIMNTRNAARYVVESLGPSDVAAVVFPRDAGRSQDFTDDRTKLLDAIDHFDPREPDMYVVNNGMRPGPGGGDMPQRFSPILDRSPCQQTQLTVPAFDTIVARLSAIPNRRKTVILVSTGVPLDLAASRDCPGTLASEMRDVFRRAARANVNMYSIDPGGYRGYENYLQDPIRRGGRPAMFTVPNERAARAAAKFRQDFMEIMAEYTGATAVVNTDKIEQGIDNLMAEGRSYYLVGYQTSNGKPDGKFRRVDVKVKPGGAEVRTRSGYFAPTENSLLTRDMKVILPTSELGMVGMMSAPGLPLRAIAMPVALTPKGGKQAEVAVVLTARLPPLRSAGEETLTIISNLYDAQSNPGPPIRDIRKLSLRPAGGDEQRYDIFNRLTLAPGRYELRYNATSGLLGRGASIYADIEVPDFTKAGVTMTPLVLGAEPDTPADMPKELAGLLPIVPTSSRDFSPSDHIQAFVRVFQGGGTPIAPITLQVQLLDIGDTRIVDTTTTLGPDAFADERSATYLFPMPLEKLQRGPHLLSITAKSVSGTTVRRDVVFRVR